jgi:TDG/mug DNA glycosylase family protein
MTPGLPDVIDQGLDVLFCGINPGIAAAATGHHFEGRGNRFWRVLHLAGFTPEEILPRDSRGILDHRCGLTTVVERPTAAAGELSPQEFIAATAGFERKVANFAPRFVAFLGKAGYAALSGQRDIAWGLQTTAMHRSRVWVLPNPSGRNRGFSLGQLVASYRELRIAAT